MNRNYKTFVCVLIPNRDTASQFSPLLSTKAKEGTTSILEAMMVISISFFVRDEFDC